MAVISTTSTMQKKGDSALITGCTLQAKDAVVKHLAPGCEIQKKGDSALITGCELQKKKGDSALITGCEVM
ncbi:uncharacterized protein LTR77_007368 [Saxophila tyrrhenica]|uniref:Uncharacterized protein n=1 Tax=Saxophila tyrrhenica TaxID=1690608 RepID=A0AAV9P4C9_9PEZI|nr:hypothetical protein LTR77_007368 [Saxophila tyrrhenica]